MKKHLLISVVLLASLFGSLPLYAQESCYAQYLREHNMSVLTTEDADDSYDELKKAVLAWQLYGSEVSLPLRPKEEPAAPKQQDTTCVFVHLALVDSTWYMWMSVDPLADKYPNVTPYLYCNGNPIMLIDPDGMKPTDDEAAAMAAYAYGEQEMEEIMTKIDNQLGNWKPIGEPHEFFGFRAVLFGREVDGAKEYAYAFAGTNPLSVADVVSDIAQAIDLPSQYEIAIASARAIAIKYQECELTFVGHSLGGGEATAAAMATGKTAITFNPAAVSLSTVLRNILIFPASIENHIVNGDPLTIGQKLGNPILKGILNRSGLIILPGKTTIVPQNYNNAHSIYNFIK